MTINEFRNTCMEKFQSNETYLKELTTRNIEQHRKGDCRIRLTDQSGAPLKGVRVEVHQKTHDFKYGANIFLLDGFDDETVNQAYRERFCKYFNLATVPFFWDALEPEQGKPRYAADSPKIYRRPAPDLCVEYCQQNGILPKLHCLFYDKFLPSWMPKNDRDAMWELYEKRFCQISERYAGKMYELEVTNELLVAYGWKNGRCSVLLDDRETPMRFWRMAQKYFPNEKLMINEADFLPDIGRRGYVSPYYMMLENLLAKGAPIQKIGVQNHIFCGAKGPQDEQLPNYLKFFDVELILRGLDLLGEFGKPLEITEVTIPMFGEGEEAEALQAEMLRAFYTLWFSVPQMESIVYWNTADGHAWVNPMGTSNENNCHAGLFHGDMAPKKAALALRELFEKTWHTDLELTTDENGEIAFRGFYGDYDLECLHTHQAFGVHRSETVLKSIRI